MEVLERNIELPHGGSATVYPLGDIHMGAVHCDEDAVERKVEQIRTQKNSYWLGMGDYAECITKNDPRFQGEVLSPWVKHDDIVECQRHKVVNLFAPIATKCIGLLTGNHEESIHQHHQDNFTQHICDDLGVPWAGYAAFILLKFTRPGSSERHDVTIHAWHGAGAAQTYGARVQRLSRLVLGIQADVYLMGHLHSMESLPPAKLGLRNGKVKHLPLIATITGSWLKTYMQGVPTGYGERQGYMPSNIGCPSIIIHPESNTIKLELSQVMGTRQT